MEKVQIITFYEFKPLGDLPALKGALLAAMRTHTIRGTIIIAAEGYNATVAGAPENVAGFIAVLEMLLATGLKYKSSFHAANPFRRSLVKIKPEIVTLRRPVAVEKGRGTHVAPARWNELLRDGEVLLLDARNDYECAVGTFRGAVNPRTEKFSELPAFVAANLDPSVHKKVAIFCTGGIRCEKFAPYLVELGFETVYQLEGGILRYLADVPPAASLWQGECYVFDERVTVDERLRKGVAEDLSAGKKRSE